MNNAVWTANEALKIFLVFFPTKAENNWDNNGKSFSLTLQD